MYVSVINPFFVLFCFATDSHVAETSSNFSNPTEPTASIFPVPGHWQGPLEKRQ